MRFMFSRACPVCGGKDIHHAIRHTLADKLFWFFAIRPYRCRDCNTRHYGFRGMKPARGKKL